MNLSIILATKITFSSCIADKLFYKRSNRSFLKIFTESDERQPKTFVLIAENHAKRDISYV